MDISVILPTLNDEEVISDCLESIYQQSKLPLEVIVVDGGSSDRTLRICSQYPDLSIYHSGSIFESLNRGVIEAAGDVIARVDADTILHSNRFETQSAFLSNNEDVSIVGSGVENVFSDGQRVKKIPPEHHSEIKNQLLYSNPMIHPSLLIRKDIFPTIGLYREYRWEDYELYTRAIRSGYKLYNIQEALLSHRIREDSLYEGASMLSKKKSTNICRALAWKRLLL